MAVAPDLIEVQICCVCAVCLEMEQDVRVRAAAANTRTNFFIMIRILVDPICNNIWKQQGAQGPFVVCRFNS